MSERRRNLLVLLIVARPARRLGRRPRHQVDEARPRPPGRRPARLPGQADQQQTTVTAEALQRALDIMRERVDAFGVSEPEIARTGEDQIEVNLPGVEDAERAAEQVGSTAQLFFYDWEKNVLDENCKTNETEVNGGQQPITGLYNAVKQASKCDDAVPKDSQAAAAPRFYAFDKVSKKPFNNGLPDESKEAALEGLSDAEQRERARCIEVPAGRARPARREGRAPTRRTPTAAGSSATTPALLGHRHQEPRAELRPARRQRADRHVRLHRQGPEGVPGDHEPGRPARRRQRRPAQPRPGGRARTTSRSRSTTSSSRSPFINFRENPDGIDGSTGAQISGGFTITTRAGPGEGPQDRRAAAEARPDLALAGLGHARPAGARPGPQGRHRGLRDRRAVPARLLPRARASSRPSRSASTPSTSTRSSS